MVRPTGARELTPAVAVAVVPHVTHLVLQGAFVTGQVGGIARGGLLAAAADVFIKAGAIPGDVLAHLGDAPIVLAHVLALVIAAAPFLGRGGGGAGSKQSHCQRKSREI